MSSSGGQGRRMTGAGRPIGKVTQKTEARSKRKEFKERRWVGR